MSKRMNSEEPGLFDFVGNVRSIGEARLKVDELQKKVAEEGVGVRTGHTKKINRKIGEARSESRRAFLRLLGGGATLLGGAALAGRVGLDLFGEKEKPIPSAPKPPVAQPRIPDWMEGAKADAIQNITRIEPVAYKSADRIPQMMELQDYWKRISLDSVYRFKEANPKVSELANFMEKNAVYSIPVGPVITQRLTQEKPEDIVNNHNPNEFEVVFMPPEYASRMKSLIITESGGRTVRVTTLFRSHEWLGIMLAHELSHVHDGIVGNENSHNRDEWLAGEVKAHLMEMDLLKHWNPKTYGFLIEKGIPLYRQNKYMELKQLFLALYPLSPSEVSPQEFSLGCASCLVSVVFTDAMKNGLSEKDLQKVYQQMTQNSAFF